jgi:predicted adenylyl cyclase CyaB
VEAVYYGAINLFWLRMSLYEVEVKSLLGVKENADALIARMQEYDASVECISKNSQLNHYFEGGDIHALYKNTEHFFDEEKKEKLKLISEKGTTTSVRTRQKDEQVLLVVKASVDEGTSANTVTRMEFEEEVPVSLFALDALVETSGYHYQAKWSRERQEYIYKGVNVCLDKNAGYGYLAEFEKMVADESELPNARREIDALMAELGVVELSQERLARMFDFYNKNWSEYYGTEKTFTIQ